MSIDVLDSQGRLVYAGAARVIIGVDAPWRVMAQVRVSPPVVTLQLRLPAPQQVAAGTMDWGDGTLAPLPPADLARLTAGQRVSLTHEYGRAGTYTPCATLLTETGEGAWRITLTLPLPTSWRKAPGPHCAHKTR